MTENEYSNVINAFDKAEESTRPFMVPGDDEIVVVGDANDTEVVTHDFIITFKIPTAKEVKRYKKEYKNVYVTPRMEARVMKVLLDLIPFFRKVGENGTLERYTDEESMEIFRSLDNEVIDRMYDLVGTVLHIDPQLVEYIELNSVLEATTSIFRTFPELINEAQTFFQ